MQLPFMGNPHTERWKYSYGLAKMISSGVAVRQCKLFHDLTSQHASKSTIGLRIEAWGYLLARPLFLLKGDAPCYSLLMFECGRGFRPSALLRYHRHLTILQCLDHHLRVHHHVLGVCCFDMLTCLGLNLVDKGAQQIDGCSSLTTILCRLGCIELGRQTVGHSLVIDEAFCGGMLDAYC